jgi:hypothetical protein
LWQARARGHRVEAQGLNWHFGREEGHRWDELPQPSTRAIAVLDFVGVDWAGYRRSVPYEDSGHRPALPEQWPHADAEIIAAAREIETIEETYRDLMSEHEDHPRLAELDDQRRYLLGVLENTQARTVEGMQAKAAVVRATHLAGSSAAAEVAFALAEDVMQLPTSLPVNAPGDGGIRTTASRDRNHSDPNESGSEVNDT